MTPSLRPARFPLAALAALAAGAALAQPQVIDISGANFQPLPLAVAAPVADALAREAALELDQALLFDLTASGLFRLLDRKGFLAEAGEGMSAAGIRFSRWADVGADALVKVRVTREGQRVKAELRLFAVGPEKEELQLSEERDVREARRLAHAFADALVRHYTREPGQFQSRLAFVRKSASGKDVWLSDWDGRNAIPLTQGGLNILPAVAPDGAGAAFTSYRRGRPDLFAQRAGAPPQLLVQAGQMATGVAYSPDGKRIAYSVAQGDSAQLWVAGADGSSPRPLTTAPYTLNTSPAWSPDGKRLAFVSNRGGSPQLYVMGALGGDARRLTFQGSYNQTPDWSPRGDLIAFTARDERNAFDLFTVHVETGKIARLTQDSGNNEEPSFSPNGRLIVFTSTRGGTPQLYVMTADGQNQLPLPMDRGAALTPDWGPVPTP